MRRLRDVLLLTVLLICQTAIAGPVDLEVIRDHVDREMIRTARMELDEFMEVEPENPEALVLLARCRMIDGSLSSAYEAAARATDLKPSEPEYWRLSGRLAFLVGRELFAGGRDPEICRAWFYDSEIRIRRLQEMDLQDSEVRWRIGQAREWQGEASIAEQFFDVQIKEFPRLADGYRCLGGLLMNRALRFADADSKKAGRLRAEGFAVFDQGLKVAGDDARLLFAYAEALEEDGDAKGALAFYLRSVKADPEFTRSWNRISKLADPAKVILPAAIEALKTCPTAADAAWWAGFLTNKRKPKRGRKPWAQNEEALGYLLPALEEHGDHEGLYTQAFLAAQALYGGNPRKAPSPKIGTDAFTRIHRAFKWSGDAANNLGFFYREARKYRLSIKWYLQACERAPENQDILNDTGLIFLFHFPRERKKGLPYFLRTISLVIEGAQQPERGYWDALENLCKHYWEVDRQPEKVIEYARLRYLVTKGVKPYNMSQKAANHAKLAKEALDK